MDLFKEGLELFGVYQYVYKYQSRLCSLFVGESIPLTASRYLCVCVCVCVCVCMCMCVCCGKETTCSILSFLP